MKWDFLRVARNGTKYAANKTPFLIRKRGWRKKKVGMPTFMPTFYLAQKNYFVVAGPSVSVYATAAMGPIFISLPLPLTLPQGPPPLPRISP
jgi:hypothetical protein